jgi:hypothetical protein
MPDVDGGRPQVDPRDRLLASTPVLPATGPRGREGEPDAEREGAEREMADQADADHEAYHRQFDERRAEEAHDDPGT